MWIVAQDILGDFDVMFVPFTPYDLLRDDVPEFGEHGWTAADFDNPDLYVAVWTFGGRW